MVVLGLGLVRIRVRHCMTMAGTARPTAAKGASGPRGSGLTTWLLGLRLGRGWG